MPGVIAMASPLRAVIRKEVRESAWKLWLGVGLLILFGGMLGPMFELLGGVLPPGILELLPAWLRGPLGDMLGDYQTYLWYNWYGKNLYQMMTLFAVVFGAGIVAGEVSHRTSGFLHSKPVGRAAVLYAKYGVALGVLWAAALAGTAAAVAGSVYAGHPVDIGRFLLGLPAALAGTAAVLAVVLVASVSARESMKAAALGAVWLLALSTASVVRPLRPFSLFVRMAGGRTALTGQVEWVAVLVMFGAAALLLGVASRLFRSKEL